MTATALFTVLYELTMLDAHHSLGMAGIAVFSLFVRKLPPERSFLVACGIELRKDATIQVRGLTRAGPTGRLVRLDNEVLVTVPLAMTSTLS